MGFWDTVFGRKNTTELSLEKLLEYMRGSSVSNAGVPVTWGTALKVTTVLACVRKIADGLAAVPVKVYRRDPDTGDRLEARDHPLFDVLSTEPNQWQSSLEYRETLAFHAALTGNAYSFINRASGKITELIPIEPGLVTIETDSQGRISGYLVAPKNGDAKRIDPTNIWHVRGPSWDATCGLDAVQLTREAIGLALATEQSHASLHKNGAMPSGVMSVDGSLSEADLIRLAAWVKANVVGLTNASTPLILDRAAKWTPLRMTGVDTEHIKTRQMQVEEICHAFNVLPIVIGVSENNTSYASVEQMFIAHLVHTVRPWHRRFSQSMDRWLLSRSERKAGFFTGFVDQDFLSVAMKDRAEYFKIALGGGGNPGWLTPNQVRAFDEMPAVTGGDNLYVPTQLGPIGEDGIPKQPVDTTPQPSTAVAVRSNRFAVGRVLSSENERLLRDASDLLGSADNKLSDVLKKLDKEESEDSTVS